MKNGMLAVALVGLAFLSSSIAFAQTVDVTLSGGGVYFQPPPRSNVGFLAEADGSADVLRDNVVEFDPAGWAPSARLDISAEDVLGGSKIRVSAGYTSLLSKNSSSVNSATSIQGYKIDGNGAGIVFANPGTVFVDIKSKYDVYDFIVGFQGDSLSAGGWEIAPQGNLFAGYMQEISRTHVEDTVRIATTIEERMRTFFVGPEFGVRAEKPIGSGFSFYTDAVVSVLYGNARYKGTQDFEAGFNPLSRKDVLDFSSFRGRGLVGVKYDMGWANIGVDGGAEYWSDMPYADYADVPVGVVIGVARPGPVGVGTAASLSYQGSLRLTIPFGSF